MRRMFSVLLMILLLLLPGCGNRAPKDDGPLTMNPDGTLGNLRWGMRYAEAASADSRIVLTSTADPNVERCTVEFLGKRWTLELYFNTVGSYLQNGVRRLSRLTLCPLEEGSWEELVEPLEAVLGPRNVTARYLDPKWDEEGRFTCSSHEGLPKWAWAWESTETMGSRLTDRELAAAYPYAEDLNALRWGTPLFTVYFQYRDARDNYRYSYQDLQTTHLPAAAETELPSLVMEGGHAAEAQLLKTLLRSEETDRPPLSPGADLSAARLSWQGEDYFFTGTVLDHLPGKGWYGKPIEAETGWYGTPILVGAVKPSGTKEELTGNLDGYVYMQRNLLFPLFFRWREWDEEADGPEPYLEFSIRKGSGKN